MKVTQHPPFFRRAVRKIAWRLHQWAENRDDARMDRNGESWLVRALVEDWAHTDRTLKRVVIDAGANRGDFTRALLAAADAAGVPILVHAFEPGPEAFSALALRFANEPRVTLNNAAIADFEGAAPLFAASGASECASLVQRDVRTPDDPSQVAVITLAAFILANRIERIDFLKLDIEGAELAALLGCGDRLNPTTIGAILFEYGGTTLDAGKRLRDFFELLNARGYRVGKLFPGWIEVRYYEARMDNFFYSNWVAIAQALPGRKDR